MQSDNPYLGRFLSVDAHSGKPSVPQSWNRYAYALNSPLRLIDPDGLWPRDIIVVPLTVVLATPNKDLQHRVQRSVAQAQQFFSHADIQFSVKRVTGSLTWEGSSMSGQIATPNGPRGVGDFVKSTRGLVVFAAEDGNFRGLNGATQGVGGPTFVGTKVAEATLSDELAHALGNVAPGADWLMKQDTVLGGMYLTIANGVTDVMTDMQELRVGLGLGMQQSYEDMLRGTAWRIVCPQGKIPGTSGPCD
jgi:hypothetical protein